ncbi:MAG: PAS domain S-box protein [Burkholderiales bacterium]|nr:PAS domain S-box protein [Burkholderiales bacterium]
MAYNGFKDSVFTPGGAPRPRGVGLRAAALALVMLAVVPVLVLLALAWHAARTNASDRAQEELLAVSRLVAAGQEQLVEGTRQLLISVSSATSVQVGDWGACQGFLQRLGSQLPNYVSVGVINAQGDLVCRSVQSAGPVFMGDRAYFQRALRERRFTVGDYVLGRVSGSKTIPFAMPVQGPGEQAPHAVAFVGMDLRTLNARLRAVPLPGGVTASVTDAKGVVLASTAGLQAGTALTDASLLAAVRAGSPGLLTTSDETRGDVFHQLGEIPVAGGSRLFVILSASEDDMLGPARLHLGVVMAAVVAFLLVYAAAIGVLVVRWVISPLRQLGGAMRRVERGDYTRQPAALTSPVREVQLLHHGLQTMWRGLERRRRERDVALMASDTARAQMLAVLEQMDDGFMVLDSSWNVTYCNPRAAELVRQGRGVEGMLFWDLFPDEKARGRRERCLREVEHGRVFSLEDYHSRYQRWFEIRFFPSHGGIGAFVRDATAQRAMMDELSEREQGYRELFEANPNVMWIFDSETLKFLAVNTAAVERYGYSREEFLAMSITDIRPPEDRDKVIDEVRLGRGASTLHDPARIWRHITKSGEVRLVEVARHPIVFNRRPSRLVMVSDVTARMESESRLRVRHHKLQAQHGRASQALGSALQMLAGYAQLLEQEVIPVLHQAEDGAPTQRLQPRAAALGRLLGDVLLLSRPAPSLQTTAVDLAALAQEETHVLRRSDPSRRVHIEIESALVVQGDPAQLAILVRALLGNAWKFTARERNGWIRMGRVERAAGEVPAFFVSDNGVGFDDAQQKRLVLPFERLHSEAEYPGHGLGLALAQAAVAHHGGRLWARSQPGEGATFCFELEPAPDSGALRVSEVVIDPLTPDD